MLKATHWRSPCSINDNFALAKLVVKHLKKPWVYENMPPSIRVAFARFLIV